MKNRFKTLAIVLAIIMAMPFVLTGCGSTEEPTDEGQNPIMNFVGNYVCDRANILIEADGDEGVQASVKWAGSASETYTWTMSGPFDADALKFEYSDCVKTFLEYNEDGDVITEEDQYHDGKGSMTFIEGDTLTLTWQDDEENAADGMVFEYVGTSTEEEVGMPNPWKTADSLDAAAKGAGLDGFEIPEGAEISLGKIEVSEYRYMDTIAEADIEFPAVQMTIRKGSRDYEIAEGDISGDYGEYKHDWTMNIKGLEVKCFGNREGEATKTIWNVGDIDYSINVLGLGGDDDYGLPEEDLNTLITGIQ